MRENSLRFTVFAALLGFASGCLQAQDIAGTWQGSIQAGKAQRIVVKIAKATDTEWHGVVYSLDSTMAYEGRATTQMSQQGTELRFAIAPIETSYQGKLSEDGAALAGTWTQSGTAYPLNLARAAGDAAWEIPKAGAPMAKDADPGWEVLSVKAKDPNNPTEGSWTGMRGSKLTLQNRTVLGMMEAGYGVQRVQILGVPHWIETERWDVEGVPDVPGRPDAQQRQSLIRKMLEDRFGLKLHRESRELAVYAITVAKGGAKMDLSAGDPNGPSSQNDNLYGGMISLRVTNITMDELALGFQGYLDRPAVNQTGLAGKYDFQLKWNPDESHVPADGNAPPGLFTAIQQQIGLKLEPTKAPKEVLVVDAVERPSAN